MHKSIFFLTTLVILIIAGSCAKIYHSPDAKARARTHQIMAVVPPTVTIAPIKNIDAEAIKEQQKRESITFQQEMYSWMLRRKRQGKISVEVQDVKITNAKLLKAGYFKEHPMSPFDICKVLNVDGIMTSNYSLSKPMSEGGALAKGVILGAWETAITTIVTLEIHDRMTKKILWNCNHELSGGVGSTPAKLVDEIMRAASRQMPYYH